ncbi:MAG: hypothetical protein JJU05_04950 [Verrucomicrobia bacterium]|nr:hypothetical protein [Verrucomicrobiota bacterium]MCH8526805.1 hypothetical protein [Kiritimatiellia bacterium]
MTTPETTPETNYSHPDASVRHSYPLAIQKAGVGPSFQLLMRTLPYALVRLGILVGISIATIIWIGSTVGISAWLGARVHEVVGGAWMIGGFGIYGYVWYTIVRYFLYLLKCGHIAVLTELITKNEIGNGGENMFQYGKNVVVKRFKQVNVMFGLDMLITGVVRAFNRTLDFIGSLLPVPGLKNVTKVVGMVLHAMTTYIDETIFSYNLARGDENPWRSGKDGLVYYAQNSKEILKTSIGIVLLEKVLTAVAFIILFLPAFGVAYLMPGSSTGIWAFFIAALFAFNVQTAILHPLFLIMIMTKFHTCIKDQPIDETWDARLNKVSNKFQKIKDGIRDWDRNNVSEKPPEDEGIVTPPVST